MGERRMPARYRMDETGQMRRTWNGKLPEEFNEKDMLLFAIDTDLLVNGRVSAETQNAVREAGYRYENGNLLPLETQRKEAAMENQKNTLDVSVKVYPLQEKGGNLLAFASATVGGCFAVNGIRVMDSEKGKFVAMPSSKGKDGKYHDICCHGGNAPGDQYRCPGGIPESGGKTFPARGAAKRSKRSRRASGPGSTEISGQRGALKDPSGYRAEKGGNEHGISGNL